MLTIIRQKLILLFRSIIVKLKNFNQILQLCEQVAALLAIILTYSLKPI